MQVPLTKNPKSSIWNPESMVWNPESNTVLDPLHEAKRGRMSPPDKVTGCSLMWIL